MKQALEALLSRGMGCLIFLVLLGRTLSLHGATTVPGIAEVRAVTGNATYITNGSPARALHSGMRLHSGATIKTGPGSIVDLFLGSSAGNLRLAENSTLIVGKFAFKDTGVDTAVEVDLELPDGDIYFNVNKLSKASRYEVRMPNGVAGIRGTKGSYSFRPGGGGRPPVVLLEGRVVFSHTPAGGGKETQTMSAPPAVYYSVTEGVKPAPPALVSDLEKQLSDSNQAIRREAKNQNSRPDQNRRLDRVKLPEPYLSPGS